MFLRGVALAADFEIINSNRKNVFIHPPISYLFINFKTASFTWNTIQKFQDGKVEPTGGVKSIPIDFKKWILGAL